MHAGSVLIARMNYVRKTVCIYRSLSPTEWLDDDFAKGIIRRLFDGF